ncbi:MAG: methylglyoxal synthase, partial [uncultured bacterium]
MNCKKTVYKEILTKKIRKSPRKASPMPNCIIEMEKDKKIALVAHDNKKKDLLEWAKFNRDLLAHHDVYATGTT